MSKIHLLTRWGRRKTSGSAFIQQRFHFKLIDYINAVVPSLLLLALGLVIYEFGFKDFWYNHPSVTRWLHPILIAVCFLTFCRLLLELFVRKRLKARVINAIGFLFALFLTAIILPQKEDMIYTHSNEFLLYKMILYSGILLGFITEISHFVQFLYSRTANPGILFVGSFVMLIVFGAFLLKLPTVTNGKISTLDSLFTSTSAVCVTGLIVVDTGTQFTQFGQVILLLLIQVGGLGFMTLTGLLAYAVAGESSYRAQLAFTNIMSSRKIGDIMRFVYQVVFVTFLFELCGAIGLYIFLDDDLFTRRLDKIFFAVFHSISAFCNAGFSTNTAGLYDIGVRYNYPFQFIIAVLVILGGMGFPIVFNLYRYIVIHSSNTYWRVTGNPKRRYFPNIIMLNSRLALIVSGILLGLGFIAYYIFEQRYTLAQHPTLTGKLVISFFGSVTPRTAGFNNVDVSALSLPVIMLYLLLMWIGASPGSTGGGIKTTTAGVAFLNMKAVLRGQDRTEFFRSEISAQSVRRAFAIIISSLIIIGTGIFFITFNDSDKGLIKIAFEVFSAFSTVGLSLGITSGLSPVSKAVLMVIMFIGRVGTITLLVIFIRQNTKVFHRYPTEEVTF